MENNWTIDVKTPPYVMMSSDFSQQEPKLTAFVSQDPNMIKAFKEGRDIYAFIASIAFNKPYEECLEFHPETGEIQPQGKARRNEAKTVVLGICYGRSVPSIGQQLYGTETTMTDEAKTKEAQRVYDSVLKAFPNLKQLMLQSQAFAHKYGYVETILGRRRHLPDMMLDPFEFKPLPGYVNPEVDPLDLSTLDVETGIPDWKIKQLEEEFSKYKYFGQIAKRTRELYENENIKVVNNNPKINDAKRQCVNCVDFETEILTVDGWMTIHDLRELEVYPKILAYSQESNALVFDEIQQLNINDESEQTVVHLHTKAFDAMCTKNHRWVMRNFDTDQVRVFETEHILRFHRPRYHILRIADNQLDSNNADCESIYDQLRNPDSSISYLTYQEIFNLGRDGALKVYNMFLEKPDRVGSVDFADKELADRFQLICLLAGYVSNISTTTTTRVGTENKTTYRVTCSTRHMHQTARIDLMKKDLEVVNGTWCPTTGTGTWIARRNGKYYITGNSIIQGSAADFTKTALINVATDPRWAQCGGEILTLVHDEIIAQAPMETYEEAAKVLKEDMEKAGEFLPFPIKCDVTTSYRWYGLSAPCPYTKPNTITTDIEDEIKWLQYHLIEMEFALPTFKDENGDDPVGDAAHGVSGIVTDEMNSAIKAYCKRYRINEDSFIDDIEQRVQFGLVA